MVQIYNYNVNDILTIRISRRRKSYLMNEFDLELSPFIVNEITDPDIILNIGKFAPSNDNCYIVDNNCFVKENYFYCKDSIGKIRWEIEIFNIEIGKAIINYNCELNELKTMIFSHSLENSVLRSLIYYKLSEKGYTMIHAAGICKDGEAFIFPGRGGAFKTSIVMDFLRKGKFSYLGDDRIILNRNMVLCFPANIQLFSYLCDNKGNEIMSFKDNLDFMKDIFVNKKKIKPIHHTKSCRLSGIFFVTKMNNEDRAEIKKLDFEDAIDKLVKSNEIEIGHMPDFGWTYLILPYYNYMLKYSYVFPNSIIAGFWNHMAAGLKELLMNIPIYEIYVPKKYTSNTFKEIQELIGVVQNELYFDHSSER